VEQALHRPLAFYGILFVQQQVTVLAVRTPSC